MQQKNCGCTESVCARPLHTAARPDRQPNGDAVNGFNSLCLQVMTGEHYRELTTVPAYDLVLAVRRCCLRYLGHVLRMPADRMVRGSLMSDSIQYPTGSLFSDCQGVALPQLVVMASNRAMWRAKVASQSWTCMFKAKGNIL